LYRFSIAKGRLIGLFSEQDVNTDRHYPSRENKGHPDGITYAQQQHQCQRAGHDSPGAVHHTGAYPDGAKGYNEYPRHADRLDSDDLIHHRSTVNGDPVIFQITRSDCVRIQQSSCQGCPDKSEGQKQQPAPKKYGGKQTVFPVTRKVANHTDEP